MDARRLAAALAIAAATIALAAPAAQAVTLHCGDVVTRSVTLDADIRNCPGDGLIVGADNVVINLNGHRISHAVPRTFDINQIGVDAAGHDGVIVSRGRITDFGRGVYLDGDNGRVDNLHSDRNHQGVEIDGGFGNRVVVSRFTEAGNAVFVFQARNSYLNGLTVEPGGGSLRIFQGEGNRLDRNRARDGIFMFRQQGGEVTGNRASAGGVPAVNVAESDGVLVRGNDVNVGNVAGVRVSESSHIQVISNFAFGSPGNTGTGLVGELDPVGAGNLWRTNLVQGVGGAAMTLLRPRGALVENNTFGASISTSGGTGGNAGGGILINGCCEASDVTIRFNKVHSNGGDGIFVPASATNLTLTDNDANFNGGDGIQVDTPSAFIARNDASRNAGWGILAVPGVTDGGGNHAHSNGAGDCSPSLSC